MSQRKTVALLLSVLLPIVGLTGAYVYFWGLAGTPAAQPSIFGTQGPCFNATVIVEYGKDYGNGVNQTFIGLNFPSGATVFEALLNVTSADYQYSGQFVLVTAINGVHNNVSANLFWQYYVNGVFGPVASNLYHLGNNSVVEWRYQSSQF